MGEKKVKKQVQIEHLTVADHGLNHAFFVTGKWEDFQSRGTSSIMKVDFTKIDSLTEAVGFTKTYSTAAITEDITELMTIAHRTEGKVDKILNIVEEASDERDEESSTVTDEDAKRMIQEFISERDEFYPSDIAYDLNLDYDQVCRVLRQLKEEGAIGDIE